MSLPLYRPFETVSLENAVEDLVVRFILNVPPEDLATVERILFHFEEASWFYTDFVKLMNPYLPNLSIRRFAKIVKDICPLIWNWDITPENALVKFSLYKRTIPVRGAAIFNENLSKILLLKGSKSKYWSFPRGKIGKDEDDVACCIREVKEETSFDLTGYIDADQYVERNMNGKNFKIYLVKGVPEDFDFKPEHKNEIEMIEWKDFRKLSKSIFKNEGSAKVFLVNSMIRPLSLYVKNEKRSKDDTKLKQYAEEHLKLLLGLNKNENKIVLDAGRELMEMLQKSAKQFHDTSGEGTYHEPAVNVQQARNLFPLMAVPSLSNKSNVKREYHNDEINMNKISPKSSATPVALQSSSKDLLAFLHDRSEKNSLSNNLSDESVSSFPSAHIKNLNIEDTYEEFESSSENDDDGHFEDALNNPDSVWDSRKEDSLSDTVSSVPERSTKPAPKSKITILKRPESRARTPESDTSVTKPKIRLLKRGDTLENIVSSNSSNSTNSTNSTNSKNSEMSSNAYVSSHNQEYKNAVNNGESIKPVPQSSELPSSIQLLSLLKKNKDEQRSTNDVVLPSAANNSLANETFSSNDTSHPSPRANDLLQLLKKPSIEATTPIPIANQRPNELLDLLKRPKEQKSDPALSLMSSASSTKPSNELLNILKNPSDGNKNPSQIPIQGMSPPPPLQQQQQQPPHIYPFQQMLPPQGYIPQVIPFANQNMIPQQQYMYQHSSGPYHQQTQPQQFNAQAPQNESQELLNILHGSGGLAKEQHVNPSSELLSMLRK